MHRSNGWTDGWTLLIWLYYTYMWCVVPTEIQAMRQQLINNGYGTCRQVDNHHPAARIERNSSESLLAQAISFDP